MNYSSIKALLTNLERTGNYDALAQLYKSLPAVYREKDQENVEEAIAATNSSDVESATQNHQHLQKYLSGFAVILDQLRHTLDQRLKDISPLTCQPWLLPYFADLLDVKLLSPLPEGQRIEIARGIDWRQRKGTLSAAVEIAEAVGQFPVVAVEGLNTVARTPRIGSRLRSLRELGESQSEMTTLENVPYVSPSQAAERPGLPAVTVNFRDVSQPHKIWAEERTPVSKESFFDEEIVYWQQDNTPHGVPLHSSGFANANVHTPDLRGPTYNAGHHHPKHLSLYTPVPEGFIVQASNTIDKTALKEFLAERPYQLRPSEKAQWFPVVSHNNSDGGTLTYAFKKTLLKTSANNRMYCRVDEWLRNDTQIPAGGGSYLKVRSTLLTLDAEPHPADWSHPNPENLWPGNRYLYFLITGIQPQSQTADMTQASDTLFMDIESWNAHWHMNSYILQIQQSRLTDGNGNVEWQTLVQGGTWNINQRQPGLSGLEYSDRNHLTQEPRWPAITIDEVALPRPGAYPHQLIINNLTLNTLCKIEADCLQCQSIAIKALQTEPGSPSNCTLLMRDSLLCQSSGIYSTAEFEYCTIVAFPLTDISTSASDCILLGKWEAASHSHQGLFLRYCCAPEITIEGTKLNAYKTTQIKPHFYTHPKNQDLFGNRGFAVLHQKPAPAYQHGAENSGELGAFHKRFYTARFEAVENKLRDFLPLDIQTTLIVDEHWNTPKIYKEFDQIKYLGNQQP